MPTKLTLAESHKIVLELKKALNTRPNEFEFNVLLEKSQIGNPLYKNGFLKNAKSEFDDKSKKVNDFLNYYDDLVKLKTHVSKSNTQVGLDEVLVELTHIDKKVTLFKSILNKTPPIRYDETQYVNRGHYSEDNVNGCYEMAEHEHKVLTSAPQFSGNIENQTLTFDLYDKERVQELHDETIKTKTSLEKKRDALNQETSLELNLSESTKKLCGL